MKWRGRLVIMGVLLCFVAAFSACSDDDADDNGNETTEDAGPGDTGPDDVGEDTGPDDVGEDTGPDDAGEDTGPDDAGEDTGPDDVGEDTGPDDVGNDDLTYEEVWSTLDGEYGCSSCHGGLQPPLAEPGDVIEVASECDGTLLVDPGHPEDSLLWRKITPDVDAGDVCGSKMPQGDAPVDAEDADLVYDWIEAGAPE